MSDKSIKYIVYVIKTGLFILPVLALIVSDSLFFPFISGKNFFFRIVVEILLFLWVFAAVFDQRYRPRKTPLLAALSVLALILILATIFGQDLYRSFWSNYERMEGLLGHLHLFAYFLILTSTFRTKRDWKIFFSSMLAVSLVVVIYGLLQFFGKVSIHQSDIRLDATLGNSTYLAIFLIFHMFLTSLFFYWFRNIWMRIGLVVFLVLEFIVMFLTATRGAILGFFGGLFLLGLFAAIFSKNKKVRYGFLGLILGIILLGGLFFLLKDQAFVKNNYVLTRFTDLSFAERTVESRFTIWGMSWRGFQEHPLLGWGPENYNLVFNKYFEPKLWRQEPWFDRSHNIIFDWLISAGALGFLAYLSVFWASLLMLWRGYGKNYFSLFEAAGITALFGAYSFHNLFVFDNLTSYFVFFSVLGYIQFAWIAGKKDEEMKSGLTVHQNKKEIGGLSYLAVTSIFILVIFSLYYVNLKPLLANTTLLTTLQLIRDGAPIDTVLHGTAPASVPLPVKRFGFDKVFSYNTFGNGEAREQLSSYANQVVISQNISQEDKTRVLQKAIDEMEKQVNLTRNNDIRYLSMLASLYTKQGRFNESVEILNRALALSPNKQQIRFVMADVYFSSGQDEEALRILQEAYDLDPTYHEAIKNLALAAIINNQEERAEELLDELVEMYGGWAVQQRNSPQFVNAYAKIGNYEKVKEIWLYLLDKNPDNAQYHVSMAATYLQLEEREKAIEELERAVEINPQFKEQADYFISEIRAGRNP